MSALRIDVADLLAHPGARRTLALGADLDGLAGSAAIVRGPVLVEVSLERIPDGIVARGEIGADWSAECSVCLRDLDRRLAVHVDELFEPEPVEGETYPLVGHELDLEQMVRDVVLLDLPLAPQCGDETCHPAPGAPGAGADRDEPAPDPRWAALSELEL